MNRDEVKIFLTFFVIYSLFIHWAGWAEDSNLALTRAIADEGKIDINSYYNITGDRAYFNGNYYSGRPPGISFIVLPEYMAWKVIYYSFLYNENDFISQQLPIVVDQTGDFEIPENGVYAYISMNSPTFEPVERGLFLSITMVLVTLFTSVLFSALTVVLVYKFSAHFTENRGYRLLVSFAYGLGTLAFPFSSIFIEHITATFFIFLSFFILFAGKTKISEKNALISGGLLGVAAFVSVIALPIFILFLGYSFLNSRKKSVFYFVGFIAAFSVFLIYNYVAFSTIFPSVYLHMDNSIWTTNFEAGSTIESFIETAFYRSPFIFDMLFSPSLGLFFFYPILLLSIPGIYFMLKDYRKEGLLIIGLFLYLLLISSVLSFIGLWGSSSFGNRFMIYVIPFLVLPILILYKEFSKNKFFILLFIALLSLSVFHNVLGLQEFTKLERDSNPLYDYYLPNLIETGPRSRLLEGFSRGNIDIRETYQYEGPLKLFTLSSFGIVTLETTFFSLYLVLLISFLIWRKEVLSELEKFRVRLGHVAILFIIPLVFLVNVQDSLYYDNWYPGQKTEDGLTFRWMSQNATLFLHSDQDVDVNMLFRAQSIDESRTLTLYANGKEIDSFTVDHSIPIIETDLMLQKGENLILFHSDGECVPVSGARCISLLISDVAIT